jgi:hypothetical protein
MSIKEFREFGYLQESNRQFFHPLGIALEITQHKSKFKRFLFFIQYAFKCLRNPLDEDLTGVWDSREDSEGFYFDYEHSNEERKLIAELKSLNVFKEQQKRRYEREKLFNNIIEPIWK